MTRFVVSLAAIIHLFVDGAAFGKDDEAGAATVHQRPTKQSWAKALSKVQTGMTLDACDKLLKRIMNTNSLEFRTTSVEKGSQWPVRYYVLDQDWGLFIVHNDKKILRFWIGGTEDLKEEVDASIFPLVRAIHRVPSIFGERFDPAVLVRSVNTLQAAGFKQSLRALRAYNKRFLQSSAKKHWRHFRFDHQRIFLISHLLFVPKNGKKQFPIPALGAPGPRFKFLEGSDSDYEKKIESGDPNWPYFPLALTDDVPLLLVRGFSLAGSPTPPRLLLKFVEKKCRIRKTPLRPSSTPWTALDKFLASAPAQRERALQSESYMLQLQVLRALIPAADIERRKKIQSHLAARSLSKQDWKVLCKWFVIHKTYWNPRTQSYQSAHIQRN